MLSLFTQLQPTAITKNNYKVLLLVVLTFSIGIISLLSCTKTNTAPSCAIEYPENFSSFSIGEIIQIQITCHDQENNISKAILYINDLTIPQKITDNSTYTLDTKILTSGDLTIALYVEDTEGLSNMDSVHITLEELPVFPEAHFVADKHSGVYPLPVCFTDSSTNNPQLWHWDFGDGATSAEQNPCHTYDTSGVFTVSLATGIEYICDTVTKINFIEVLAPDLAPKAGFIADTRTGPSPLTVTFSDTSTNNPSQWFWEFGDGTTSTERNPVKTYTRVNRFFVALEASNEAGSNRMVRYGYIVVSDSLQPPVAIINIPTVSASVNSSIQFMDASEHNPDFWLWEFGDGAFSAEENPEHTYNQVGTYTVQLTVRNALGHDSTTMEDAVSIYGPCMDAPTVMDIDGNSYNTVQIGAQCWMAENLKTSHYPDGTEIPYITNNQEWVDLLDVIIDDAYCYPNNQPTAINGALYTYAAATAQDWFHDYQDGQGICPDGWHLPNDNEWKILEGFADSQYSYGHDEWDSWGERGFDAGHNIKATYDWSQDENGDNRTGFTAIPEGIRDYYDGKFYSESYESIFWTSTEADDGSRAVVRQFKSYRKTSEWSQYRMSNGFSIRCVKN